MLYHYLHSTQCIINTGGTPTSDQHSNSINYRFSDIRLYPLYFLHFIFQVLNRKLYHGYTQRTYLINRASPHKWYLSLNHWISHNFCMWRALYRQEKLAFKIIISDGGILIMNLSLRNVSKTLRNNTVISDISVEWSSGHIYGLKGINGAGKTMLMRLISGLLRPSQGEIYFDGEKLGAKFDFAPSIGLLLENPGFLAHYTGFQNLAMIASLNQKISSAQIQNVLNRVGLDTQKISKILAGNAATIRYCCCNYGNA